MSREQENKEIFEWDEKTVFSPHPHHYAFRDLTNLVFKRLTVVGFAGIQKRNGYWYCNCQCGTFVKVASCHLKSGRTTSCGCLAQATASTGNSTHGQTRNSKRTPEYQSYVSAKKRCNNARTKAYPQYGGRGVQFKFQSFDEFFKELGRRPVNHTLDRIDNDGHYETGNVRWASHALQHTNRRITIWLTSEGETKTLTDWCADVGISYELAHSRKLNNWCDECILKLPKHFTHSMSCLKIIREAE